MSEGVHNVVPAAPAASGASGQQVTVVQPQPSVVPSLETLGGWAAAILAIAALVALIAKLMTRETGRDLRDTSNALTQLDHKVRNQVSRIDALEHSRLDDVTRIVKLESAVSSMEKSISRVEHGQEKLSETINSRFDQLAESIREIRTVAPRS